MFQDDLVCSRGFFEVFVLTNVVMGCFIVTVRVTVFQD